VFDYLSKEDRERVEHAAAGLHPPALILPHLLWRPVQCHPASLTPPPQSHPPPSRALCHSPMILPSKHATLPTCARRLRRTTPSSYLQSSLAKLPKHTKELSDYSKSAAIFKPVSGAMASRFTTAAVVDLGPTAIEGLHQPTHEPEPTPAPQGGKGEREERGTTARRRKCRVRRPMRRARGCMVRLRVRSYAVAAFPVVVQTLWRERPESRYYD
jgi:hypothetical protein